MIRPLGSILLCAAASLALSGCAALAVPVATGLIMGKRIDSENDARRDAALAQEAAPIEAAPPPAASASSNRQGQNDGIVLTQFEALPAPSTSNIPSGSRTAFAQLEEAALAVARRDPLSQEKRLSAILADPTTLEPDRRECAFAQSAVLIDLDPGNGEAPLADGVSAPSDLPDILARLRAQEVAVLWLTRHTADRAGAVRRALRMSGLDPEGQDDLYLVRYETETKATRRADAAADYCIIAIMGDEKRDFDELFAFLKDPDAAFALETLLGEAWFLAPAPLGPPPITAPQIASQD